MSEFLALQTACLEANLQLLRSGLSKVVAGYVSLLDSEAGVFAVLPQTRYLDSLKPQDIVILNGEDGTPRIADQIPVSDSPTHLCLYQAFSAYPEIKAIAHTSSPFALAYAQAGQSIPCLGTLHASYFFGDIPVTRYMNSYEVGGMYEWEMGKVVAERFRELDPISMPAVLVKGHGVMAWGDCGERAVENAAAVEKIAEIGINTLRLQTTNLNFPKVILDRHFRGKDRPLRLDGQPFGKPAEH